MLNRIPTSPAIRNAALHAHAALLCFACAACAVRYSAQHGADSDAEVSHLTQQAAGIIETLPIEPDRNGRSDDIIAPRDTLSIEVWMNDRSAQFEGFPLQREVPMSGEIFVPRIGMVSVAGNTDSALAAKLTTDFSKLLSNPSIVVEHKRRQLTPSSRDSVLAVPFVPVMGRVVRPGVYAIENGITVRDMIAHAGGAEDFAAPHCVYVVRGSESNRVEVVDLQRIQRGLDMERNLVLRAGDAVYVPPSGLWVTYDVIRRLLLPVTAVRDAVWVASTSAVLGK